MKKFVLFLFAFLFSAPIFAQWILGGGTIKAVVTGNSVIIHDDSTVRSCFPHEGCWIPKRYEMQVNFSNDTITWIQHDLCEWPAGCDCYFNYSVGLDSLPNATYTVMVYFTLCKFCPDTLLHEGTTQFTISGSTSLSAHKTDSTESPCLGQYTGLAELSGFIKKLYPNPSEGVVNISLKNNSEERNLEISDIYGKVIRSIRIEPVFQGIIKVDLSGFSSGIYYCQTSWERHKIVKL